MRRHLVLVLGLAAWLLAPLVSPAPAEAGCVVLKNGEVIVGRIRDDEITKDQIIVRWPYKDRSERGEIDLPRFRIRWFDKEADEPTDEYWEEYGDKNIDSTWLPLYEKWKLRRRAKEEALEGDFLIAEELFNSNATLSPIPVENADFKIQIPQGWTSTIDEHGITIFESDKPGTDNFRARIHVFSVKSARGQKEEQVKWVENEVAKLAGGGGKFDVTERKRLKLVTSDGWDQELLTETVRLDRPVYALRKFLFRKKNTYFFTAYAHRRDYGGLEILFKACMRSLEIKEDEKAKKKRKKSGGSSEAPTAESGGSAGGSGAGG